MDEPKNTNNLEENVPLFIENADHGTKLSNQQYDMIEIAKALEINDEKLLGKVLDNVSEKICENANKPPTCRFKSIQITMKL